MRELLPPVHARPCLHFCLKLMLNIWTPSVVKRGDTLSGHTMPRDILGHRIWSHFHVNFFVDVFCCPSHLFACGNPAAIEISHSTPSPHGGLLHFYQKSTCLQAQLSSGPCVVQLWSSYSLELSGDETFVVQRVGADPRKSSSFSIITFWNWGRRGQRLFSARE